MGWWSRDHTGGVTSQATTSQQLTTLARAPIFNDNRVEAEPIELRRWFQTHRRREHGT
jgi:hypothetical protein